MGLRDSSFWKWIIIIGICFVIVRISSFWLALAEDEQVWVLSAMPPDRFQFAVIEHPPLTTFLYSIVGYLGSWRLLHIVPLLFSTGIFIFTILLARKYYGRNVALISGIFLTLSAWAVLAASQIDMDGSVVPFFGIASLWFFLEGIEKNSIKDYVLSGIILGIGFYAKNSLILFLIGYSAYKTWLFLFQKKKFMDLFPSITVYIAAFVVYALFPLYSYITGNPLFGIVQHHASEYFFQFFEQDFVNVLSILAQTLVLITPLLLLLFVYSILKWEKKDVIFIIIPMVYVLFYLFIATPSFRPFERYWMPAIPFMCILGAKAIDSWKLRKNEWISASIGSLAFFLGLVLLAVFLKPALLPLFPKEPYLARLFSFNWNFFFPFHGASGPLAFFIPFWSVPLAFVLCFISLAFVFFRKNARLAMIIFVSLAIGFNVFMVSELLFSPTGPNINKVSNEITDFALTHDLSPEIYAYQGTAHYLLNASNKHVIEFYAIDHTRKELFDEMKKGSTVLVVDFPSATRDSVMWKTLMSCKVEKKVIEKGYDLGYVFIC